MTQRTDFTAIKEVAKDFTMLPVEETELSPLFVAHPFFESGYVAHNDGDKGLWEEK